MLGKIGRIEIVCLQTKRGDGRPQFMRSIGDKTPLLIHHQFHSLQ
ncbi:MULTISPECIES: hypothetical protein [unclassified Bradyrhizobium]|nr:MULTISPECIES: hypothetical protein [unclassified Bradyrhizobium]